jgi:2-oxoglutarate/2-oxoacid ferredoxin oxidoreductase subunit alpha
VENMERLARKQRDDRALRARPRGRPRAGRAVGVIAFGTTRYALAEARDRLAARGTPTSSLRLKALPPGTRCGRSSRPTTPWWSSR